MRQHSAKAPLLASNYTSVWKDKSWSRALWWLLVLFTVSIVGLIFKHDLSCWVLGGGNHYDGRIKANDADIIESDLGVVAADDGRCSEIGVSMLRLGGHAVDAAVATTLCLGIVNPMGSGIGGGAFMIVRSSATSQTQAFDMRETAPLAASENMYKNNPKAKYVGGLSVGVPGEIAGLYEAWLKHGRLAWRTLFRPAIKLAKEGFIVAPYLGQGIAKKAEIVLSDRGLRKVYAPNGKLLKPGDKCYNVELAQTLEAVAEQGPQAFYNGSVGEKLVKDVREAGGILTMEDLRNYKVNVMDAMSANVMGYTIFGMPPPSSGTVGMSLVLNILESYGISGVAKGILNLHRFVEALKHMFAARMNLGDPDFVNVDTFITEMLSKSYAKQIQEKIFDNTTFPPEYYMNRWSQLRDHGTSHICIVDADRNAVSMTTTINLGFGARMLSPTTGIIVNDEMGDFSTPTDISPDKLPPAPSNFIRPNKRPLSSMTPLIVTKDNQLAGVIGGGGGLYIIPAVIQVFLNHFILGMDPLVAVQNPRVYHELMPNVVYYENWTLIDGDHIELAEERKLLLEEKGHQLEAKAGGANVQLVIQTLENPIKVKAGRKIGEHINNAAATQVFRGKLTAVSDPRKNGRPAAE